VALHLKCKIADICDDVPDEWIGPTLARRPSEEDVQIYRDMARRLRIVREAIGMSVEQFSVRYGVAPDRWADVEENTILPNVSVLKRLCLDYDVTLDFLVFGIFRQNPPPLMAKIRQTHPELVGEDPADHVIPRSLVPSAVSMIVSSIAGLSISSTFLLPTLV
jgi:transcriptional regulator with XRE-family HTH domain